MVSIRGWSEGVTSIFMGICVDTVLLLAFKNLRMVVCHFIYLFFNLFIFIYLFSILDGSNFL